MARLTNTTAPTGRISIDRSDITVTLIDNGSDRRASITVVAGLQQKYNLPDGLEVVLEARAGNTLDQFRLGRLTETWHSSFGMSNLDASSSVRLRFFLRTADSPKIIAACDRVRIREGNNAESLLPLEAADLGELVWRLEFTSDGPVLLFNRNAFPTGASAIGYVPFRSLVIPVVLREIVRKIGDDPALLDDAAGPWHAWGVWLDAHGIERPLTDSDEQEEWVEKVIRVFCARHMFCTKLSDFTTAAGV